MISPVSKSVVLSLVCFTALSFADNDTSSSIEPCSKSTKHYRASVRHIESGGIGYNQGYTTLETFLAPDPSHLRAMPFLDLRGHVFDNGKLAANAGVGIRTLAGCRVYGINAYYDYRNTTRQHYNQVGLGLETLGVRWDFRLNGYLPLGDKTSKLYDKRVTTTTAFDSFQGNQAYVRQTVVTRGKVQYAMKGLNAEAAFHILKNKNVDLYAAAGPYYYNYSSKQAIGGQARIGVQLFEYLSLEVINSYDSRFHENFQGSVGIHIPFGPKQTPSRNKRLISCQNPCLLAQRLVQDVERQEIIVVDRFHKTRTRNTVSEAINPLTGSPYTFWFVDNTSSSDGTFESPFSTLLAAQNASSNQDIIYVFPGNGTTTGMDGGIVLKDDQKLYGSGKDQSLSTTLGMISIPAQSSSSPEITNTTGDAITLAAGNEIRGFVITRPATHGIYGLDPANVQISSCTISDSQDTHINLAYADVSGTASLDNLNLVNGVNGAVFILTSNATHPAVFIQNSTLIGNSDFGISLQSDDSSTMDVTIQNNTIKNHSGNGVTLASNSSSPFVCVLEDNLLETNGSTSIMASFTEEASISLTQNRILANQAGASFTFGGESTFIASGNTFQYSSSVSEAPLKITAGTSPLTATIQNNIISENVCGGIHFILENTDTAQMTLTSNTITNNGVGAIGPLGAPVFFDPNGTLTGNSVATLTNNTISGNAGNGIYVFNGGFTDFQVTLNSNTITHNAGGVVLSLPCDTLTCTAMDNDISYSEDYGLSIADNIGNAVFSLTNNKFNGHVSGGVGLFHTGTDLDFTTADSEFIGNMGTGIIFYGSIASETVTMENNTISNNANSQSNAAGGIDIENFGSLTATIQGNTLVSNVGGVFISASEMVEPDSVVNIDLNHNTFEGSPVTFSLTGTYATTSSTFEATDNIFSYSNGTGLNLNLTPAGVEGTLTTLVEDNVAAYNTNVGILAVMQSASGMYQFPMTLSSNVAHHNFNQGIYIEALAGEVPVNADDNTLYSNGAGLSDTPPGTNAGFKVLTGVICLEMSGNDSDTGYLFTNHGTFNLAPCNVTSENEGTFFEDGMNPISHVQSCPLADPCP